jgi:hypothetical protein
MKRALLIGTLSMLAVVGGAFLPYAPSVWVEPPGDRITILKAKVIRLPMPTQGYQPFTPSDVIR